jgi:hypothetical protein
MFRSRTIKLFLVTMIVMVFATAAYAFAASNTVPSSKAGDGSAAISGYAVTSVQYVLNSDPTKIDQVKFTLDSSATTVKAKLVSSSTTWFACTIISGNNWGCTISGAVNVADTNELRVVAVQ